MTGCVDDAGVRHYMAANDWLTYCGLHATKSFMYSNQAATCLWCASGIRLFDFGGFLNRISKDGFYVDAKALDDLERKHTK